MRHAGSSPYTRTPASDGSVARRTITSRRASACSGRVYTSLVSVIAVPDLVYNAPLINADTYRPLEVYTIVALIYFAILFPATLLGRRFERGMTYDKA